MGKGEQASPGASREFRRQVGRALQRLRASQAWIRVFGQQRRPLDRVGASLDLVLLLVSWLGSVAGTLAVTLMAVLVATEVIARQVFNNPFLDAVLTGRLAMIFIIFLGIPWVMRQRRHVAVEFIVERMPVRARAVAQSLGLTIALGAIGLAASETWEFAHFGRKLNEKLLGGFTAPAFPFQFTITIGFALLGLEVIRRIVIDMRQAFGKPAEEAGAPQGNADTPFEKEGL